MQPDEYMLESIFPVCPLCGWGPPQTSGAGFRCADCGIEFWSGPEDKRAEVEVSDAS